MADQTNNIQTNVFVDVNQPKTEIANLNKIASDTTKTLEERIAAKNKAVDKQNSLSKQVLSDLDREKKATENLIQVKKKELSTLGDSEKQLKKKVTLTREIQKEESKLLALDKKINTERVRATNTSAQNTKQLNKLNQSYSNSQRPLNAFREGLGGLIGKFALASAAMNAIRSVIRGFIAGISDSINRIREFDATMQEIAGIARVDRKELESLESKILEVAGASTKTSNEVAKLASALITLGKTPEEIEKLLEPTNNLSIAMKASSEDAGEFLVQMLNAFGKGSDEAGHFADVIAGIRSSTTLDFQKMRDSFQYIAPVSKILNKDLEYTGALVGVLADNGLKAESSGRLLASSQLRLSKSGMTLQDGLDAINNAYKEGKSSTEVLGVATELFGVNAAKVGIVLATNTDKIEEYDAKIRQSGGALDDLVNSQLESLDAKLNILNSTWEEALLKFNEAVGASDTLKGAVEFLSNNLVTIIKITGALTTSLVAYGAVMLLNTARTKLFSKTLLGNVFTQKLSVTWTNLSTAAMNRFNAASKANIIGAVIALVMGAVAAFKLFSKSVEESTGEVLKNNDAFLKQKESQDKVSVSSKVLLDKYKELKKELSKSNVEDASKKQDELNRVIKNIEKSVPNARVALLEYNSSLDETVGKIQSLIDKQDEANSGEVAGRISITKESLSDVSEELVKVSENYAVVQEAINKAEKGGFLEGDFRDTMLSQIDEISAKKKALESQKKSLQDDLTHLRGELTEEEKRKKKEKEDAESEKKRKSELIKDSDIQVKSQEANLKIREEEIKRRKALGEDAFKEEVQLLKDKSKFEQSQEIGANGEKLVIEQKYQTDILKLKLDYAKQNQKIDFENRQSALDQEKLDIESKKRLNINTFDEEQSLLDKQYKLDQDKLKENALNDLEAKRTLNADLLLLEKQYQNDRLKVTADSDTMEFDDSMEEINNDKLILEQRSKRGEDTLALELELLERERQLRVEYAILMNEDIDSINLEFDEKRRAKKQERLDSDLQADIARDELEIERLEARGLPTLVNELELLEKRRKQELENTELTAKQRAEINGRYDALEKDTKRNAAENLVDIAANAAAQEFGVARELALAKMLINAPTAIGDIFKSAAGKATISGRVIHIATGLATVLPPIYNSIKSLNKTGYFKGKNKGSSGSSATPNTATPVVSTGAETSQIADLAANNAARSGVDPNISQNASAQAANNVMGSSRSELTFSENRYSKFQNQVKFKEDKSTF